MKCLHFDDIKGTVLEIFGTATEVTQVIGNDTTPGLLRIILPLKAAETIKYFSIFLYLLYYDSITASTI